MIEDEEPELIFSDLSGTFAVDGHVLEVNIVRLANKPGWSLEVVNERGTSTTWDDLFISDGMAWKAFEECVEQEGVEAFFAEDELDEPDHTLH
ncbi:hypothetical protein [Aestuariicoccus sp. MJ-SS9]|uniref:hypothetical protein n=1 Tax=Aestuariicoccus sp. MJ-SS9 TaxID=3079855 RepID=UPI0029090919|nr:hypothetical protein [Aestuariicoccus sp. MJ-SS9]MDU8913361.1 hypothetical protein [Aestuariicoccus sp. MJ-SS9]